jgi:hypothetical protein
MKKVFSILFAATVATTFAMPAFAGPAAVSRSPSAVQPDESIIAELQEASRQALREGRTGNKNNPEFTSKNYEINQLIQRLKNGQKVDPAEIDNALEPVHVW